MSNARQCPVCGAALPADAPRGLCPNCLMGSALGAASPAARRFGDYELLGEIAQGGMGVVHYARQVSANRTVALKMIRSGQLASAAEVQRFRTEAEAAANLDHPNIVPIYEVGAEDGHHFFSMKLMESGTLADLNAAGGARNRGWLLRMARLTAKLARAVQHAHQRGVLHRDIKPTNILLDESGEPHLTDFGLAKLIQDRPNETQSLAVLGTPGYMSPEQAAGKSKQLTTATDVYSLGAVLFELLTREAPFKGDSTLEVLKSVQEKEPPRPQKLNPAVDRDLETICLKCLEKEPHRRYASAEILAEELERWLADEPIQARPVSRLERTLKWTRRNPVVAGLSAVAAVIFLTGLVGVLWQWRAAKAEAVRADANSVRADASAAENRQRLARSHVVTGMRLLDEGAPFDALLFLAEAMKLDTGTPSEVHHRLRLAAAWQTAPRLVHSVDFGAVLTVAQFSRNGRKLLASGEDGSASVWDTISGERLFGPRKLGAAIMRAGFCYSNTCVLLAGLGGDGVHVYDVATGQQRRFFAHPAIQGVAITVEGHWMLTYGGEPCDYRIWNLNTGDLHGEPVQHPEGGIGNISPDGRFFATVHGQREVVLWDRATMKPLYAPLVQDGMVSDLVFSLDGERLLIVSFRRSFQVWNTATGKPIAAPVPQTVVSTIRVSPDQRYYAGVANRGTVKVWDAATGQLAFPELRHESNPGRVLFSEGGSRLLVGSADGTTHVWDYARETPMVLKVRNSRRVNCLAATDEVEELCTGSNDGNLRLWDCRPRTLGILPWTNRPALVADVGDAQHLLVGWPGQPRQLVNVTNWQAIGAPLAFTNMIGRAWLSRDATRLVVQCVESNLYLLAGRLPAERRFDFQTWDVRTGQRLSTFSWTADAQGRAWANPTVSIICLGTTNQLAVYDPITWQPLWQRFFNRYVQFVAFDSQSRRAAILAAKEIHVVEPSTGTNVLAPLVTPVNAAYADFRQDGRVLATASGNSVGGQIAYLWDTTTGKALTSPIQHLDSIWSIKFSPDGTKVVTASTDHSARVWDARTGEPLTAPLKHSSQVNYAEFSADGRFVVTAGDDTTVRVWDVESGTPLTPLMRHANGVAFARFLGAGRQLLSQSIVGDVALWSLPDDPRPAAEWSELATLLSARRLNAAGSAEPVDAAELSGIWRELRARAPQNFLIAQPGVTNFFPIISLPPGDSSSPFRMSSVFNTPH